MRLYPSALSVSEVQILASSFDPAAPTNLTATAASSSQINLGWTDNASNESNYKVERSLDGVSFTVVADLPANTTSYSSTGLAASTQYFYQVIASNSTGDSAPSKTAKATTLGANA